MHIVPKQGIKGLDIMVNLVRANTYISGYVMHNSVRHYLKQFVSASYWFVCICTTIGKHTLACNRQAVECFHCS